MATTPPTPLNPITIEFSTALESFQSPAALAALVDRLGDLSPRSINNLQPLVVQVLALGPDFPAADLLKRMLHKRPEWIRSEVADHYQLLSQVMTLHRCDLVDVLIDAGVDPNSEKSSDFNILDFAITIPADPHIQESFGNSLLRKGTYSSAQKDLALTKAALRANLGMMKSLVAHGAGFGTESPKGTALAIACDMIGIKGRHQLDIVQAMLQVPGVSRIIDEGWGNPSLPPPISRAASEGNVRVMSLLLEAGARVNPPEELQLSGCKTPLMEAARWLHPEAVDLLIKHGADAAAIDSDGKNALHHLATYVSWNNSETVSRAQNYARRRAIDLLIDAGADFKLKDNKGMTPLDHAEKREHPDVIEAFRLLDERTSSRHLDRDTPPPVQRRPVAARRL